jgi:fructose-1,6-bisphosphatase
MLSEHETTLTEFIIEEQRRSPGATGVFTSLLNGIRLSCKRIAWQISEGTRGTRAEGPAGGDPAAESSRLLSLDTTANDIFLRTLEWGGNLAGMISKSMQAPHPIPEAYPLGRYLLAFNPLDGASNIDVNVSVGSIFSVLRAPESVKHPTAADFLQPGTEQVAAGYTIFGPTTMLVLTVGRGVNGFTLNRGFGEFVLTHPGMKIPAATQEFAVNSSNARFWEPPVQRYVDECVQGKDGPRAKDFNMRWVASLVAEVHRILVRGGLFLYPADTREDLREGRLELLYEANPLAMLIEQAGGAASTGRGRILEATPRELHQRVPVILGSREEVERLERYHSEQDDGLGREFSSPLFNQRSLFPNTRS